MSRRKCNMSRSNVTFYHIQLRIDWKGLGSNRVGCYLGEIISKNIVLAANNNPPPQPFPSATPPPNSE